MSRILRRLAVVTLSCVAFAGLSGNSRVLAQEPTQTVREEPRLKVSAEVFCSETKLRTSNARIRWSMNAEALEASGVKSFSTATQSLEATVYKNGFEKGLLASIPISHATRDRRVAAQAQGKSSKLRAFQFSLIEVDEPKTAVGPEGGGEMAAVVEGLEPGVNYTWRIAIETAAGRIVSAPTTSQAQVCPADFAPTTSVPRRKR